MLRAEKGLFHLRAVVLSLVATRAASSMLFGVAPHDPLTVAASTALMALVAFAASPPAAYRAASVDPIVALREE
jgi:putative ABC transport system permease protein